MEYFCMAILQQLAQFFDISARILAGRARRAPDHPGAL
jgi:hypothetical protein